jgi:prevent-host-death family protein
MDSVNMAEAKSRFSELVSRAASGERFLIRRRERPAAVLISIADLERLERGSQAAHGLALALGQSAELMQEIEAGELHPAMAAFGLWSEAVELEALSDEIHANRRRQASRPGMSV